jgi:hypothetical protein
LSARGRAAQTANRQEQRDQRSGRGTHGADDERPRIHAQGKFGRSDRINPPGREGQDHQPRPRDRKSTPTPAPARVNERAFDHQDALHRGDGKTGRAQTPICESRCSTLSLKNNAASSSAETIRRS